MKRERGNQLYLVGGAVLALALLFVGAFSYVGAERKKAFAAGELAERAKWQKRENEELRTMQDALEKERARRAQAELEAMDDLLAIDEHYQKEAARVQAERDRFMDDLAAGRVRFFDPGRPAGEQACSRAPAEASTAAGRGDGEARAELSAEASRFLHGEAGRADRVVEQLTAAQGVIETYRKTCR